MALPRPVISRSFRSARKMFRETTSQPAFPHRALTAFLALICAAQTVVILWHHPSRRGAHRRHPDTKTTPELLSALKNLTGQYKIVTEKIVYDRYARVYDRTIKFPSGVKFAFDIWGRVWKNNSFAVVITVPFDRATQTFTLIREYNIAHQRAVYGFPAGQAEIAKHGSPHRAAAAELEEESHQRCREWQSLLAEGEHAVPQDKYQREVVHMYLCSDAVHVDRSAHGDAEENIEVLHGVTVPQLREISQAGVMQSNMVAAGMLAIDYLRKAGLVPHTA